MAASHRYRARSRSRQAQINLDQGDSSSDYSDWLSQTAQQLTFSPPKHKKRRKRRPANKKTKLKVEQSFVKRSSDWFVEEQPWRRPYFPQMGDDVVYFVQGHQLYMDAIRNNSDYDLSYLNYNEPWTKLNLNDHEFGKVIGIKYEIDPMPLCCLKIILMDDAGHLTGDSFSIKYHPIPGVHDFLILKQLYDFSIHRKWPRGAGFKYLNADHMWHSGVIEAREPFQENFPRSLFRCYRVIYWDDATEDTLSPWDMEPIIYELEPEETIVRSGPANFKDVFDMMSFSGNKDWGHTDRGAVCRKLLRALEDVFELPIAGDFINPDPSPDVEYPINLEIIKARLENRFYRYLASVKFDIRYLAKNAEKSNPRRSIPVKYARILVDICLEIIRNINSDVHVDRYYHKYLAYFDWSDSDEEEEEEEASGGAIATGQTLTKSQKSPAVNEVSEEMEHTARASPVCLLRRFNNIEEQPSTSGAKLNISPRKTPKKNAKIIGNYEWKHRCREVLEILWACDESRPFRYPADPLQCPDYEIMVSTPMCLQYIDECLREDNYRDPKQIFDDLRLLIANARRYYDNKKREIYRQIIDLSHVIDELMKPILRSYNLSRECSHLRQERSSRNSDLDEDEMDETSSDCNDDLMNDSNSEMINQEQMTYESNEAFSQVVDQLSQQLDHANLQNDGANVDDNSVRVVRNFVANRNIRNNAGAAINVRSDAQTSEDRDTGFEDHSAGSSSWDDVIKLQL